MDKLSVEELAKIVNEDSSKKLSTDELADIVNATQPYYQGDMFDPNSSLFEMGAARQSTEQMTPIEAGGAEAISDLTGTLSKLHLFPKDTQQGIAKWAQGIVNQYEATNPGITSQLVETGVKYSPAAMVPEFDVLEGVTGIPKAISFISKKFPSGAIGAGITANPDENLGLQAALGGGLNTGLSAAFSLLGSVYQKLTLKGLAKRIASEAKESGVTPESIEKGIQKAGGSPTLVGDIVKNPALKEKESTFLPKLPYGNEALKSKLRTIFKTINERSQKLFSKLVDPSLSWDKISQNIINALNKASDEVENEKRALYDTSNELADKNGIQIGSKNLFSAVKSELKKYLPAMKTLGLDTSEGTYSELTRMLDKISKNDPDADSLTLAQANYAKSLLGDLMTNAKNSGEKTAQGTFTGLYSAFKKDINDELSKPGNEEVKKAYEKAETFFRENVAPFRTPEMTQILTGNKDPDLLVQQFLPKNGAFRVNLLKKILKVAPDSAKYLLNGFLAPSFYKMLGEEGELEIPTFLNLLNKLGDNRLKLLTSPENVKEAQDLVGYAHNNKAVVDKMFLPRTGERAVTPAVELEGALFAANMATDLASGNLAGAAKNAIFPLIYPNLASNLANEDLLPLILQYMKESNTPKELHETKGAQAISQVISAIMS